MSLSVASANGLTLPNHLMSTTALSPAQRLAAANDLFSALGAIPSVFANLPAWVSNNIGRWLNNTAPRDIEAVRRLEIAENSIEGALVGTVRAENGFNREMTGIRWEIVGGRNAESFTIDATGTIRVRAGANLDFETNRMAELRLRATDEIGRSYEETKRIRIHNANERPTDIIWNAVDLPDQVRSGTQIATVLGVDPDFGRRPTVSLVSASGPGMEAGLPAPFAVRNGVVTATRVLEQGDYAVTLRATDRGGLTYDETFMVRVGPPPTAPTDILLSQSSIAENGNGDGLVNLAYLTAVDADQGDRFIFRVAGGPAASDFVVNGNVLMARRGFDHETEAEQRITLEVTDRFGLTFRKDVIIAVSNVNESPFNLGFVQNGTVFSTATAGALVGTASASDPDRGDVLTYSLHGADAGPFRVDASGNVIMLVNPGWNGGFSRNFTLVVTDLGGLSVARDVSVRIQGVAPEDLVASSNSIEDGTAAGSVVSRMSFTGFDPTNSVTWSVSGGPDARRFAMVGSDLVTTEDVSAARQGDSRTVVVRATERDGSFREEAFTFSVERTTSLVGLALSDYAVSEGLPANHVMARILSDDGTGNTVPDTAFSITGGADAMRFDLDGDRLILRGTEFNFSTPSLSVQVTATAGGVSVSQDFSINVLAARYVAGSGEVTGIQGIPDVFMPDGFSGVLTMRGFDEADRDQVGMFFLFSQDQISTSTVRLSGSNDLNVMVQVNQGAGWQDFGLLVNAKSRDGTLDGDGVADSLSAERMDTLLHRWLADHVVHS